jgi:hypothetical protein
MVRRRDGILDSPDGGISESGIDRDSLILSREISDIRERVAVMETIIKGMSDNMNRMERTLEKALENGTKSSDFLTNSKGFIAGVATTVSVAFAFASWAVTTLKGGGK